MNSTDTSTLEVDKTVSGKPLQVISYAEKIKKDKAWYKANLNYLINQCAFGSLDIMGKNPVPGITDVGQLYDAYNNIIPQSCFDYVRNPFKSKEKKYQWFPAEIRPYNILRPNADLLFGEWNKRNFQYDVVNVDGDDVYNTFVEFKDKTLKDNITQRFINSVNELATNAEQQGTGLPSQDIPDPKTLISELNVNYKDAKALKGYRALRVLELELKFREKARQWFKDWVIAGQVFSLKIPMHGSIFWERLSPRAVAWDKSSKARLVEDGEYAVAYYRVTPSDIVDMFYDKLTKEQLIQIENKTGFATAPGYIGRNSYAVTPAGRVNLNHVDLYYVCWKSKKKVGFLKYPDPMTGQEQYDIVDESYVPDKEAGEEVEWYWVNTVEQGWRIQDDIYVGMEEVQCQRNEMNNYSSCKLPINGRMFSDTESENVSLIYLGMPYQIMYIILMYRLELMIAKSKGKIILLDNAVIPDDAEGGEEAFFWYSEAMGYALINGDQASGKFNQYQVLDMDLFQNIKQLIDIIEYVKGQWDELLGITRQRKGQLSASDGLGTAEQAIFRSSVISDIVFTEFEEFLQSELAGLLDNSKYAWVDGKRGYWRNDAGRLELLSIEPDDYTSTQYDVHVVNSSVYADKFNLLKQQINAIAQRKDVKTSTIIDMAFTDSITELKALVKKAEVIEAQAAQQAAQNEQEAKAEIQRIQMEYEEIKHAFKLEEINTEWDRKDNNEIIKAQFDKDPGAGIDPYTEEVVKQSGERLKQMSQERIEDKKLANDKEWRQVEREKIKSQEKIAREKNVTALKNKASGEK